MTTFTALSLVFTGLGFVLTMYVSDWNVFAGLFAAALVYVTAYVSRRLAEKSTGEKDLDWRKIDCPSCNMKISIEAKFCPYCGAKVEMKEPR